MKVVLMAGGKGTRISELFPDIPKPLIPIDNVPVFGGRDHILEAVDKFKIEKIYVAIPSASDGTFSVIVEPAAV